LNLFLVFLPLSCFVLKQLFPALPFLAVFRDIQTGVTDMIIDYM